MLDINSTGRITREDVFRVVESLYRVLTNMRIPLYETNIQAYITKIWSVLDPNNVGYVTREDYKANALGWAHLFQGLGIVELPPHPPSLPKRGVAVSMGHFYWSLALQMMVGMRLASDMVQNKDPSLAVLAEEWIEVNKFELSSNDLVKKYVFTDYSPAVFRRVRL